MKKPVPTAETSEEFVAGVLYCIGEDVVRPGLRDTPARVVRSWKELYGGYKVDVAKLFTIFDEGHDEMVVVRDIEFYSMCEHHMLPFFGRAHIGYLPNKRGHVVGLSKLARLVEAFTRRLQIQERIGRQIVDTLEQYLKPAGAGVVLEAQHLCMTCRGVGKQNSFAVTSSMVGSFRTDPAVRAEFLHFIGKR